jgi:hypothetical protein
MMNGPIMEYLHVERTVAHFIDQNEQHFNKDMGYLQSRNSANFTQLVYLAML